MSLRGMLKQAATYRPRKEANRDGHGKPRLTNEGDVENVPCLFNDMTGKEDFVRDEKVIGLHRLFLLPTQACKETDQWIVEGQVYNVEYVDSDVAGRGHHKLVRLREVRKGDET